ncbi:MAG: hypothetical protein DRP74_02685 [Candidatus Omnitrophota bacterium]|nr:MAG: hypothetical protein DRP74_02685 [Candidatus Omnitrophota bacterium]
MDKEILFEDLKQPQDLFLLKDHLRELYRLIERRYISVDFSATPTFDCDEGDIFKITLTGNITGITLKNAYQGRTITIIFLQDAIGSRTVAGWASNVKLAGAAFTVTSTASVYSAITLTYTGSVWVEVARSLDIR